MIVIVAVFAGFGFVFLVSIVAVVSLLVSALRREAVDEDLDEYPAEPTPVDHAAETVQALELAHFRMWCDELNAARGEERS